MSDVTERESLDALEVMLKRVNDEADYFTLLGIEPGADVEAARAAFFKHARLLYPDLPAFSVEAKRTDATKVFQHLSRAHKVLTDANLRAQYFDAAGLSEDKKAANEPNPDLAHIHMHRARQLLGRRDWAAAEEGLQLAMTLFGEGGNPECQTLLGWAIMNNPTRPELERAGKSKELWEQVLELQKVSNAEAQAAYYMAIWCKLNGEMGKVKKYLDRCLRADPRHIEAQRELRLYDRRRASRADEPERQKATARRRSRNTIPAAGPEVAKAAEKPARKVKLEKKKSWLEKLFGK